MHTNKDVIKNIKSSPFKEVKIEIDKNSSD